MKPAIALVGATGLLGTAFRQGFGDRIISLDRSMLDLEDSGALRSKLEQTGAGVLINCAAHTDLEAAERDPEPDRRANLLLPSMLARACEAAGATMIQFSSTGCYGRWKDDPYIEVDPLRPTTVHHRHKAEAEDAVRNAGCPSLILRTGWLFGGARDQPKNFVWRRMQDGRKSAVMTSDSTQFGVPTWVDDVVSQTGVLIDSAANGTFNVVAGGYTNRFGYVSAILEDAGIPCEVTPGPAFRRLADVSHNETALNQKLQNLQIDQMPEWRLSLSAYIAKLLEQPASGV